MESKLALLFDMAGQHEYVALYHTCYEWQYQDKDPLAEQRIFQILFALACAHTEESDTANTLLKDALKCAETPAFSYPEKQYLSSVYLALERYIDAERLLDELLLSNEPSQKASQASKDGQTSTQDKKVQSTLLARKAYCRLVCHDYQGAYRLYLESLDCNPSKVEVWLNLCLLLITHYEKMSDCLPHKDAVLRDIQQYLDKAQAQLCNIENQYSNIQHQDLSQQIDSLRLACWAQLAEFAEAEAWISASIEEQSCYISRVRQYAQSLQQLGLLFLAEAVLLRATKHYPHEASLYQDLTLLASSCQRPSDTDYYHAQYAVCSSNAEMAPIQTTDIGLEEHDVTQTAPLDMADGSRIKARFTHAFLQSRQTLMAASSEPFCPVFIVGVPFSGATLVEQLLVSSSATLQASATNSNQSNHEIVSLGVSSHFSVLVEGLNLKQREIGSKRSYPELMDGVSGSQLQALALGVYSLYQRKAPTASVVIDKSPHNVKHIGLIKLLFPQAKIIAVKRDPRALLSSPHARQWLAKTSGEEIGNTDLAEALGKQLAQHNDLIRHWKKEFPESVTSVSFKDLTTQPQRVADTLLDFLGVPAGPRLPLEITTKWPEYTAKKLTSKRSTNQRELSSLLLATSTKTIEPSLSMVTLPEPGMLAFAYQLYQQGKYQDSERQCRRILRYLPDFAPAHYLLGELYLRSGLLELALSSLDIAIDLAPWKASQWGKNRLKAANLLQEYDSVRKVSLHGDDEFYKEVY